MGGGGGGRGALQGMKGLSSPKSFVVRDLDHFDIKLGMFGILV